MDAPTQFATIGGTYSPNKALRSGLGYRVSAVNGNQFFADAQQVNGSLHSTYQSPYVNIAWTVHPGLVWRAEYNYYGYGEGGPYAGRPAYDDLIQGISAIPGLGLQAGAAEPRWPNSSS